MKAYDQSIHLLLPGEALRRLKKHALAERKSVGELIRQAIRKVYGPVEPDRRRRAYERLSERDELLMEDWDRVKKDLLHRYG